jgi:hypothetical protein
MNDTDYNTEHERYRGSGIIDLSQIDQYPHLDPFHHCSPEFRKERKRLEQQFRHEVCKPWLQEHHLKAQVSRLHWEDKTITGWKVLGGFKFPCFTFHHGAKIRIIERLALLEIARSSSAWGLAQVFDPLEPKQRWWVFDFFRDGTLAAFTAVALGWGSPWTCRSRTGFLRTVKLMHARVDGSNSSNAASQSQYRAVLNGLGPAKQRSGGRQLSYMASLPLDLYKDMGLVGVTAGVCEALAPLRQIPSMWLTKSFGWLNDIRTSWCNEVGVRQSVPHTWRVAYWVQEVINYVNHIVIQWTKITLQWNPIVVQFFDPESISVLQSRAPLLSTQDHDYIVRVFKYGKILTHLTDRGLREAVETEVCRQGPILTLATFAKDLRVAKTRVHDPLLVVLGTMRRSENDTLRKTVSKIFEEDFEVFSHSRDRSVHSGIHKTAFVESCYLRLFLDALRIKGTKGSITRRHLSELAECEFNRLLCDSTSSLPSYVNGNGSDIVVATSDDTLLSDSGWQDIDVERRHGNPLFKDVAATTLLNSDRIHEKHPHGVPISEAFMGKYIARVFLFGSTCGPEACPVPSRSPRLSLNTVDEFLNRLPFGGRDSASVTVDDYDSVLDTSSHMPDRSAIDTESVFWRHPHVQMATARSKAASMIGSETSLVEQEKTSNETRKRSCAVPEGDNSEVRKPGHLHTPKKCRRSLSSVEDWVPYPTSLVLQQGYQVPSIAPSIVEETYRDVVEWCGTRQAESCVVVEKSPDTRSMYSPSMYSLDRCSSLASQVLSPEYRRSSGQEKAYTSLLWNHNPFSSDGASVRQAEAKPMTFSKSKDISTEYSRAGMQNQSPTASLNQSGKSHAGAHSDVDVDPQAPGDSTASAQPHDDKSSKTGSQFISYRSSLRPNISYRAPSDARSIELFVQSQRRIDPLSTFWYLLNGKNKRYALDHKQLQTAIRKYRLETIYVVSERLGSTEPQQVPWPQPRYLQYPVFG